MNLEYPAQIYFRDLKYLSLLLSIILYSVEPHSNNLDICLFVQQIFMECRVLYVPGTSLGAGDTEILDETEALLSQDLYFSEVISRIHHVPGPVLTKTLK